MVQWLDILREKNDLAEQLSEKIPRFFAYPALSLDHAMRLHILLEKHADDMEKLVEQIGEVDLPDAIYEAASALDAIFSGLAAIAASKVAELQKKQPGVEFPPDPAPVNG
ncbi:hypothetical protein [Phyllobacterium sophorae]|uniref:Uncharacterized protein n=1 Tax=Phyllobacterium sophorae TaxID=1520277 RepID=A0A2P7ATS3_9HYPH|nr:hypothetical protein [Phyllobacterium sophorae]PSH57624.1 hypothetical protein CU103_28005 [Phyllobacterium sophorae]